MSFKLSKHPKWLNFAVIVALFHLIGTTLLLINARQYPQMIGFGFLAYTLGLRHAFDADHIAAIDNTVRKLIQQKEDPAGVGFFFSLGHSSVVFIMAVLTAFSMNWAEAHIPHIKDIGSIIGTAVSGGFLILIGMLNLYLWFDIYRVFINSRREEFDDQHLEELLLNRGFFSRLCGSLYSFINKSWHVYPLGFLFGLGFDTASEVALLAISANVIAQSIPITLVICLPILFAAGMSLLDTADGIFMSTAYNWASITPLRKTYYNLSVTGISVVAALGIGFIELTQVFAPKFGLNSGIWGWMQNIDIGSIGYLMVTLFILLWGLSFIIWKFLRLENGK
ncbi:HoxN/HupN/NixA family nickel/cobalt transporter [Desulfitobacterium sp. Sab5]|uniref:HoxN/HupN/NixA family nickel/cobalt transporter n=1 Tax=Desulfitobacterium nosdiversum TaxID=3375356 RepID=UPI003CF7C4D9